MVELKSIVPIVASKKPMSAVARTWHKNKIDILEIVSDEMAQGQETHEIKPKTDCQHDYVWKYSTREIDTYYHIHEVTDAIICKHCGHIKAKSVYQVPDDHWMPYPD